MGKDANEFWVDRITLKPTLNFLIDKLSYAPEDETRSKHDYKIHMSHSVIARLITEEGNSSQLKEVEFVQ
ncbi:MAG: hypothetical protein GXY81_03865 [Candidatus Cloacimonetes bacterium]|jgi:hypothetical protein|nr:hypothetical protein [Candidatus Cloacimonadota bacterium]OPZ48861.1 MAG: hypothetical protein BWY95_00500 [Bacteroidetes bacterium ADurb.BinA104]